VFYRWHVFAGEKRGLSVGKTKRDKGCKIVAITDAGGVVLSVRIESAGPHEVTLVEKTLEDRFVNDLPETLIGDKAYDSDPLDQRLTEQGIELIAPHRAGRKKPKTQDGRRRRLQTPVENRTFLRLGIQLSTMRGQV
jgi:IS5 family transposase